MDLFNHLVCECEQCRRHVQAERLRSLQIEREGELRWRVGLGAKGRSTKSSRATGRTRCNKSVHRLSSSRPSSTTMRPSTITSETSEPRAACTRLVTSVSGTHGCTWK